MSSDCRRSSPSHWHTPLAFLFIDGGHGVEPARTDYESLDTEGRRSAARSRSTTCSPIRPTAVVLPYEQIYLPALESGLFEEIGATGSLRVLRRV